MRELAALLEKEASSLECGRPSASLLAVDQFPIRSLAMRIEMWRSEMVLSSRLGTALSRDSKERPRTAHTANGSPIATVIPPDPGGAM